MTGQARQDDLVVELAGAPPEDLYRVARAVTAMHAPNHTGRCPWCHPQHRWWNRWRRPFGPCRTRQVIAAELRTGTAACPDWVSA